MRAPENRPSIHAANTFVGHLVRRARTLAYGVTLAVCVAAPTHQAGAQPSTGTAVLFPREGSRVRVRQHLGGVLPPKRIMGTFVAAQADSVRIVQQAGDTSVLALSSLDYLDVSLGRRRQVLASVGAGTLIGGGSLALIAALSNSDSDCTASEFCLFEFSRADAAVLGGILGAVSGAVVGGIVGAVRSTDTWQRVPLSQLAQRVSIRPQFNRSRGAAIEWRF